MYQIQIKGVSCRKCGTFMLARYAILKGAAVGGHLKLIIIDEDFYNTDGNGVILIVEREDHLFAEAARPEGPFRGQEAEAAIMPGTSWLESPNDVIEAWYG